MGFSFVDKIMSPFSIALVNSVVRLFIVLFLMPFTDIIEVLVNIAVSDKDTDKVPAVHMEERFVSYPALAIEHSRNTVGDMARISRGFPG